MIKLWRDRAVEWHNRWGAEEELNRLVASGWRILAVIPSDSASGGLTECPTFVLQNDAPWRERGWAPWYRYWWWRFKMWRVGVRGPAQP